MFLDSTRTITAILSAAVSTTAPAVLVDFADLATAALTPDLQSSALSNSSTTILAAPTISNIRQVKYINIFNTDTVDHTVTVTLEPGVSLVRRVLEPGETLSWSVETGWKLGSGVIVNSNGGGGNTKPSAADFTIISESTANGSISDVTGGVKLVHDLTASGSGVLAFVTAPGSGSYVADVEIWHPFTSLDNFYWGGLCCANSASGTKIGGTAVFFGGLNSSDRKLFSLVMSNSLTNPGANILTPIAGADVDNPIFSDSIRLFTRVVYDHPTLTVACYWSVDGILWVHQGSFLTSSAFGSALRADRVGIYMASDSSSGGVQPMFMPHFKVTAT